VDDRRVSDVEWLPREELLSRLAVAAELIGQQAALIEQQAARIAELERVVGRSSRNSSLPPSREGLDKPPPRSTRTKSGRKPGKQPGAAGTTLCQVDKPDHSVAHYPSVCAGCAGGLDEAVVAGEPVRRQVFDVPEPVVAVTEHQLFALCCAGCGAVTRAPAPAGVSAPACYGPGVTAFAAYLSAQHHIPVDRVVEILADLAGIAVSPGWVVAALQRAKAAVGSANAAIRDAIAASSVAHFDESVTRVAGHNHWLHTAATAWLTAYHIDEHGRSAKSIEAFGILPRFAGVAIHDAYSPYRAYTDCLHALCNQHVIREATGIGEFDSRARTDGWAADLVDLLGDAYRWVGHWRGQGHHRLPEFKLNDLHERYDHLIDRALRLHPPRPGKQTPARNLALRLQNRKEEFLRFTTDFTIEFTNNTAEQAIRMIKTKTKVSNGFRTLTGAQTFLAIRGYISTTRKNGVRAIHALRDALAGKPWMPPQAT
jgi:transposase